MSQVQTEVSSAGSVCQEVVELVADAEGTDPIELVPPLYEVVEPEALERLFTKDGTVGKVVFNYMGYEVSVFSDGHVSVESHGPRAP